MILQEFEEQLLDMSFELMLSQMPHLQQKLFICAMDETEAAAATGEQKEKWQLEQRRKLDIAMTSTKIPTILLERLKREFDEVESNWSS